MDCEKRCIVAFDIDIDILKGEMDLRISGRFETQLGCMSQFADFSFRDTGACGGIGLSMFAVFCCTNIVVTVV